MLSRLKPTQVGPVRLLAPKSPPREEHVAQGRYWTWPGDGGELVALNLAEATLPRPLSAWVLGGSLNEHLNIIRESLDDPEEESFSDELAIPGVDHATWGMVRGMRLGHATRSYVLMTSGPRNVRHTIECIVVDTRDGASLAAMLRDSVVVDDRTR